MAISKLETDKWFFLATGPRAMRRNSFKPLKNAFLEAGIQKIPQWYFFSKIVLPLRQKNLSGFEKIFGISGTNNWDVESYRNKLEKIAFIWAWMLRMLEFCNNCIWQISSAYKSTTRIYHTQAQLWLFYYCDISICI